MLLEFTVGNYRSFYKKRTLSMIAEALKEEPMGNVAHTGRYNVLKTAAVYGANSSGKSNLLIAMQTMCVCVLTSVRLNDNERLPYEPFLLLKNNHGFTYFEVVFTLDDSLFRYGFTYDANHIDNEWLFVRGINNDKRTREKMLFVRSEEGIGVDEVNFPEGIGNESKTNANRLFLSLCQQLGGNVSKKIMAWFLNGISVISGLSNHRYHNYSLGSLHQKDEKSVLMKHFYDKLNLGFKQLNTREDKVRDVEQVSPELRSMLGIINGDKKIILSTEHTLYDDDGKVCGNVDMLFEEHESAGTQKLLDISGPLFETLQDGTVLIVDELDAKMHPLISQYIISLFNNPDTNPKNAQLIFSTHDTHLLSLRMLRRDQIWFTEKDSAEQTDLFNMMDIVLPDGSKPRNDANYEKNYIAGRYGAIPYIVND